MKLLKKGIAVRFLYPMSEGVQTVALRSGDVVSNRAVDDLVFMVGTISLYPELASAIVGMCRDPNYTLSKSDRNVFAALGILSEEGEVFSDVRMVVLASLESDGESIRFVNPVLAAETHSLSPLL